VLRLLCHNFKIKYGTGGIVEACRTADSKVIADIIDQLVTLRFLRMVF